MSSASVTEFYGLTQYVGTDKPSFTDNNEAFQKVDEDLHEVVQSSESQAETISGLQEDVGSLGDRVTAAEGDIDDAEIAIGALQNKETLQDNDIAAVKAAALDMICAYNEAAAQSTHAYVVGDFFRYQDVLYKATAPIAIDDTIVPNVNCSAKNVAEELLAIITAGATDTTARAAIEALTLVVGDLANLTTTDKTSIVNAINELVTDLTSTIQCSNYSSITNVASSFNDAITITSDGLYYITAIQNAATATGGVLKVGNLEFYLHGQLNRFIDLVLPIKSGTVIQKGSQDSGSNITGAVKKIN